MTDDNQPETDDPLSEERFLPSKVFLIDREQTLVNRWKEQFADCPAFEALPGDYFQRPADAIVSPANSFGIMDGGLDLAIRNELGSEVQERLQNVIVLRHHGELPVGSAEIIKTPSFRWPFMIAAPTMRVPEPIPSTINAYLAFRAILVTVKNFNRASDMRFIDSLVCCGLGTGIGRISPNKCALQMRAAYQAVRGPARIPSFEWIHQFHKMLLAT